MSKASCPDGVPFLAKPWCLLAPQQKPPIASLYTDTTTTAGKTETLKAVAAPEEYEEMPNQSKLK